MEIEAIKGLFIFLGTFGFLSTILLSLMGQHIEKIEKIFKAQRDEDDKYVN